MSRIGIAGSRTLFLSYAIAACDISSPIARGQQAAQDASQPPGDPGGIGKAKLVEKPVEVLGGRLTVRMPQGARIEARPFPIMAAPESEEHETRVVFDAGPERLVLMAHEAFAFAGDDIEQDVKGWVARWRGKYRVEPFPLQDARLKAVAVIPVNDPDHSRSDDATFVEGLFVESDDRTIQSLDVYVKVAGEKDLKGCKAVARQILQSVTRGPERLRLEAGERRLFAFSKETEIAVTVPKNTVATRQIGPDFLVHRLIVVGRLGAESSSILIYMGHHPNYQPAAKRGEGTMFGKKVEWHSVPEGEGLQSLQELPTPGDEHLMPHVIITAPNEVRQKALRKVAETMRLAKPRGSTPK